MLSAGNYTVTYSDSFGCFSSQSFQISEPQSLVSQITSVDVECFGDTDGMLLSNISGGISPYSYLWNTGDTTPDLYSISSGYIL